MLSKRARGIGLLELMLSIAIIALIIIMSTRYFTVAQQQQKITRALQMSTTVLQAAHTWAVGQTTFPTESEALIKALVAAQLLPSSYLNFQDPWGGFFDVKGKAVAGAPTGSTLGIIMEGAPEGVRGVLQKQLCNKPPYRFGDVSMIFEANCPS